MKVASDGVGRMQWPLLLLRFCLPAVKPRDFSADLPTQIDGCGTVSQLRVGGPELNLIALAVALMAIIDSHRDVDRKGRASIRCGIVKGTTSVPLIASSTRRFEPDQREDLLHRDLTAKPVKVNAWHGFSWVRDRSRSLFYMGNGERSVFALPTNGGATDPSSLFQGLQCLPEAFVLDRQRVTELRSCERCAAGQ